MNSPLVSIIMSVFNAEQYLYDSIKSILNQTYTNFEFIIVNDGSTDDSLKIIQSFADEDERIRVISRKNKGLIHSLNEAISFSTGAYIGRMDADDISEISRLEKQVRHLEDNPEIGVVSCNVDFLGRKSKRNWPFFNEYHADIIALLPFHSPMVHASILIRKELIAENPYQKDYSHAEDYKLWVDLSFKTQFHNLPEILYHVKEHDENVSIKYNEIQIDNSLKAIREYLISKEIHIWNLELHRKIITSFFRKNQLNLYSLYSYLDALKKEMSDPFFNKKTDWIKATFVVNNTQIPSGFIFFMLFFHFRSITYLSIKQFLSLIKRSFIK